MSAGQSPPQLSPDDFAVATAELRAAALTSDFALTPARLPMSAHRAMRTAWTSFARGVAALIDRHDNKLDRISSALHLPEHQLRRWDCLPPHDWAMIARPDMIMCSSGPVIIDVNSSSLAGHFATNDLLLRAHRSLALRPFFAAPGEPRFVMGRYADLLRRFMTSEDHLVALTYFAEEDAAGPNPGRFHYLTEIAELGRLGLRARTVHIEDIEAASDGLYCHGERIGLIHRYFLPQLDDPEKMAQISKLAKAAEDDLVVVWTGTWAELFDSKTTIAVLSDERFTSGLRPSLAAALDQAVPWTRVVEERRTCRLDQDIDLTDWITRHRTGLVLKPAVGGMGRSVMIGREVSAAAWEAQIAEALDGSRPWVVQELLSSHEREVLIADQAGAAASERGPAVYGAFVLDGEFVGAICRHGRHGDSSLMINGVTGAVPTPVYWHDG